MSKRVKIGMISFAHPHAYTYLQALERMADVEIAGVTDDSLERREELAGKFGLSVFRHHSDLLQEDLDAVVVCSENVRHAELTIEAARCGKHVLCEKPLGISIEEMQNMIAECTMAGVKLMTAFPNRYVPAVVEARQLVQGGQIGEVLAIKGTNKGAMPGSWFIRKELSGGGAMLDHSVHVMDLMHWMLQSEVEEVYAENGTLLHRLDIDDAGMVHVKFANGVIAVVDTSWSRAKSFPYARDLSMEITGTLGSITVDDTKEVNQLYRDKASKAVWSFWGADRNFRMVRDFVEAVRDGTPVPITGEDGFKAASVALAAFESVRTRRPVKPFYHN
ncbi:MAG: dehydrogenase [Paenibacillaceae bacterium]|nr:dehydrogenase [Paenibacillaceae bacterium]